MSDRRQRIHDLVLALLAQQGDLELLSGDGSGLSGSHQGHWLERNRRVVQRYQSLVHSAVTLDALVDQELGCETVTSFPSPIPSPEGGSAGSPSC
jgi:hypothetical protein